MKQLLFLILLFELFSCNSNSENKSTEQKTETYNWKGNWEKDTWQNDAALKIKNVVGDSSLDFEIAASSGGSEGNFEGKAIIKGNIAIYNLAEELDSCILTFKIFGDTLIAIKQGEGNCFAGIGVLYEGNYFNSKYKPKAGKNRDSKKADETLFSLGTFESVVDDSIFKELTKKDYDLFLNSTQLTSEDDDLDSLNAKVYTSGVRGLFTFMENIIMIDDKKNIWAAVIDDNKVLYYTNTKGYASKLPKTVENWRSRFKVYPIIYKTKP